MTGHETRTALLKRAVRSSVPLRKVFVQAPADRESRHGPLKDFVTGRDLRGLRAYLMIVAACSNEDSERGWSTTHDSAVWARLMDIQETASDQAARTGAWRVLRRLQERRLIACTREGTRITATLLREDASGRAYHRPLGESEEERFLQIPTSFWTRGYDGEIHLPGLALLLTVAREKPWSSFPAEKALTWYGWSADTHERGLRELLALDLAERRAHYRKEPLLPNGFTMSYQYNLNPIVRPRRTSSPTTMPADATGTTTTTTGTRGSTTRSGRREK
ncbi:hypothetical protein ACWCWD_11160 [Streptomyces sp. NPDC001493]